MEMVRRGDGMKTEKESPGPLHSCVGGGPGPEPGVPEGGSSLRLRWLMPLGLPLSSRALESVDEGFSASFLGRRVSGSL